MQDSSSICSASSRGMWSVVEQAATLILSAAVAPSKRGWGYALGVVWYTQTYNDFQSGHPKPFIPQTITRKGQGPICSSCIVYL